MVRAGGRQPPAQAPAFLARYRAPVEQGLRSALGPLEPGGLGHLLHYHLGWADPEGRPVEAPSGKRVRPALCLFVCEAMGGEPRQALPSALALELIHNFSLAHDDIQDEDRERRHRPTLWALWGKPRALWAGNALRGLAHRVQWALMERGVDPATALESARILTERCLEMIEGQDLDLRFEARLDVSVEDYLEMVSRKTGALMEASTHLGALTACPHEPDRVAWMGACGRALGLAFQARDDYLGIWGQPDATGKAVGADIRRRKKSLPVVLGLARAQGAIGERLRSLYRRPALEEEEVAWVMGVLEEVGAREETQRLAEEQGERALDLARRAGLPPWAMEELSALTDFVLHREH